MYTNWQVKHRCEDFKSDRPLDLRSDGGARMHLRYQIGTSFICHLNTIVSSTNRYIL